jgi:hypothetical protein
VPPNDALKGSLDISAVKEEKKGLKALGDIIYPQYGSDMVSAR